LLESNQDKIDWTVLSGNPSIFVEMIENDKTMKILQKNNKLKQSLNKLQQESVRQKDSLETSQAIIHVMEQDNKRLNESVSQLEQDNSRLTESLKQSQNIVIEMTEQATSLEQEVSNLKASIRDYETFKDQQTIEHYKALKRKQTIHDSQIQSQQSIFASDLESIINYYESLLSKSDSNTRKVHMELHSAIAHYETLIEQIHNERPKSTLDMFKNVFK
jgi:DNA repair exonuclease SbcCD ATPase subunit